MSAFSVNAVFLQRIYVLWNVCVEFLLQNFLLFSPLLACGGQEEEESLAETAKEEQGGKQGQKSSAEDAGEEQGEEKQQSAPPDQAESTPLKEEPQKKEEGEKSESQVSIRLKEWDWDCSVWGVHLEQINPIVLQCSVAFFLY